MVQAMLGAHGSLASSRSSGSSGPVSELFSLWRLLITYTRSDDPHKRRPDISVAKEQLGWSPQVPVREGLSKTIDYFRKELEDTGKRPFSSMRNMLLISYMCTSGIQSKEAAYTLYSYLVHSDAKSPDG